MEAHEALKFFLENVLCDKKERYLGFISKPKSRKKFLNTIYHELEGTLDSSKKQYVLSNEILCKPAFVFEPPMTYGERVSSLKRACDVFEESFLAISEDGMFGIYGPETFIDSRAFYAAT